jgi:hypothetical protein
MEYRSQKDGVVYSKEWTTVCERMEWYIQDVITPVGKGKDTLPEPYSFNKYPEPVLV